LRQQGVRADLVLGLPRGGVVVAAGVAQVLGLPLDVLIVRKIGHPWQREYAVGALAEDGVSLLDEAAVGNAPEARASLPAVIAEEEHRLHDYQRRFHPHGAPDLTGKTVLLVDDGLATGATTEAAVRAAQRRGAGKVVVAAPVGSRDAVERLAQIADEVRVLFVDPEFAAVGQYYREFAQTTDEEVVELLRCNSARREA
jgi:putative phosphoribosyl transferase